MTDYEAATAFLGEWGRFQRQVFFFACMTVIPNGFVGLSVVFVADTPPHRCLVPAQINLTAAWRNSSIPPEGEGREASSCSRYKLDELLSFSERGLLPGVDVNMSNVPKEGCLDGWEYDRSVYISTIVTEVFSPSWAVFCALYFVVGMGQISNFVAAFVLGTEILGPRVRIIFSTAGVSLFFAAGYMFLPLCAFFIRDWRMLLLGLNLPGFLYVPFWWFIPESPRWLLSQGRVEEAEAIIRDAAKKNKTEPPTVIFSPLQKDAPPEEKKAHNICDLIRSRNIRRISVTLWLVWNTVSIAYFALSLNTANLHGDAYFNCFLSAVVEIPAYTLTWVIFQWCSRRPSLFSSLFTGGLFLLLIRFIPAHLSSLAIALEMTGKFAVTAAFAIVYAYTAELYPTVLRTTAVGTCSMASRIGSITAPFFIYLRSYSVSLPYILMGSLTVLTGLLSLLLPESYGMPLPDTITHMQRFPGCCQKTPYTLTHIEEGENTAERKT